MKRIRTKREPSALRNFRTARTLKQADMARLLSMTQQNYAHYETGRIVPTVDMQARIAALLGVSRQEVFPPLDEVRHEG